jgi:hypothetical protein
MKKDIINGSKDKYDQMQPDLPDGDDYFTKRQKKKGSGKKRVAPGISLMETFTATNVKASRLTVRDSGVKVLNIVN